MVPDDVGVSSIIFPIKKDDKGGDFFMLLWSNVRPSTVYLLVPDMGTFVSLNGDVSCGLHLYPSDRGNRHE